MKDEKILANEKLSDEELEQVSGGGITDTIRDGMQMYLRGILTLDQATDHTVIAKTLHGMGYSGYKQTGLLEDNIYFDKSGKQLKGPDFWQKFGEETGATIIKDREATLTKGQLELAYLKAW